MNKIPVDVIDGSTLGEIKTSPEPDFSTRDELKEVMAELLCREPLFHREEFGVTREDFEGMTEPSFWEVGASGKRYSREFVIDTLTNRYKNLKRDTWHIEDFQCQEIAPHNFLVTYTLHQGKRLSRRSTIWRKLTGNWKIVYHQGTLVEQQP